MAASLPQEVTGNTVEKDEWGFNERISYCVYGSDYERYGPYPGTSSGQSSERGTKTQGQTASVNRWHLTFVCPLSPRRREYLTAYPFWRFLSDGITSIPLFLIRKVDHPHACFQDRIQYSAEEGSGGTTMPRRRQLHEQGER
jgi:hypothetical protein